MAAVSFDSLFTPLRQLDLQDRNRNIIAAQRLLDGDGAVLEEGRSAVGKTSGLTPVAPMAVTMLVTAQCNAYAGNGQNVRARTLFHATPIGIGWGLTLVARVLRIVIRTLGMPLSLAVAAFQQSRYGKMQNGEDNIILRHNVVAEDLRRIGQEWVDGLITLFVVPLIGTINTLAPQALSTKFLFRYYEERTVQNAERDATFRAAKEAYAAKVHEAHNAWRGAQQSFSQS